MQLLWPTDYNRVADPGSVSQVHLQNRDLLLCHMSLSPSLITLCFVGKIYMSVVQCVCVCVSVYIQTQATSVLLLAGQGS